MGSHGKWSKLNILIIRNDSYLCVTSSLGQIKSCSRVWQSCFGRERWQVLCFTVGAVLETSPKGVLPHTLSSSQSLLISNKATPSRKSTPVQHLPRLPHYLPWSYCITWRLCCCILENQGHGNALTGQICAFICYKSRNLEQEDLLVRYSWQALKLESSAWYPRITFQCSNG